MCDGLSIPTPPSSASSSLSSPRDLVEAYQRQQTDKSISDAQTQLSSSSIATATATTVDPLNGPVARTVLLVPPSACSDDIVYEQVASKTRVQGLDQLQHLCERFDQDFQSELGVESTIHRISLLPTATTTKAVVAVNWNVTWVPPTAAWLEALGTTWPGVQVQKVTYNHLSGEVTTFSWKAVFRLFANAWTTGMLRIPLACIEGQTRLSFQHRQRQDDTDATMTDPDNDNDKENGWVCFRIVEELSYAQDLARNTLRNRRCSADLRVFLETGRRCQPTQVWDDIVATCLPWSSVPGSGPLDVDPSEEGPEGALVALGLAGLITIGFANFLARMVLGQSLFGPPSYIVPPDELNDIIGY